MEQYYGAHAKVIFGVKIVFLSQSVDLLLIFKRLFINLSIY